MTYQWNIRYLTAAERELQQQLEQELTISSAAARMLVVRGIRTADEARAFVRPSLDRLHDPFLMQDMDKAVTRLHQAITRREKILIYGDYDVDGTTAVAVMYRFLDKVIQEQGTKSQDIIDYYIPDRYTEGYGVSRQGIDYAVAHGCGLIITLDCGIKAVEKVAYAKSKGVDVAISKVWAHGADGGVELAEKLLEILETKEADFAPLYELELPIADKIKTIATKIYGARDVNFTTAASKAIAQIEKLGFGKCPVCIAKTQYSLSDDQTLLGRPSGFTLNIKSVRLSAGAGFVVALAGDIMTMPGLPKVPAAEKIDIDLTGEINGLF